MGVRTPGEFGSREPGGGDGVVGPLPGQQFSVELGDLEPAGGDLIELLGVGPVGPFEVAMEFGGAVPPAGLALAVGSGCAPPGRWKPTFLPSQEHDQLVLPPARILPPELEHPRGPLRGPSGLPPPVGPVLPGGQILRIVAALPAIEGLPTDPELAAGQGGVV